MANCCNGKRFAGGHAGGVADRSMTVRLSALSDDVATTSPAIAPSGSNFGLMVGAGVTIWGITKVLERMFK